MGRQDEEFEEVILESGQSPAVGAYKAFNRMAWNECEGLKKGILLYSCDMNETLEIPFGTRKEVIRDTLKREFDRKSVPVNHAEKSSTVAMKLGDLG